MMTAVALALVACVEMTEETCPGLGDPVDMATVMSDEGMDPVAFVRESQESTEFSWAPAGAEGSWELVVQRIGAWELVETDACEDDEFKAGSLVRVSFGGALSVPGWFAVDDVAAWYEFTIVQGEGALSSEDLWNGQMSGSATPGESLLAQAAIDGYSPGDASWTMNLWRAGSTGTMEVSTGDRDYEVSGAWNGMVATE